MTNYGHTPAHTAILWDADNKVAQAARQKVFAEAATNGYMIGAAHVSFPGLGHMRSEGKVADELAAMQEAQHAGARQRLHARPQHNHR
jgi:hypothetical protein